MASRFTHLTLLLTTALVWVDPADSRASPPTEAVEDNPVAHLLRAARTLKQTRPALFGAADGILVILLVPNGQGAAAGLVPGDVLIGYGGIPIDSVQQLTDQIEITPDDSRVVLTFLRGEQQLAAEIRGGRIGVGLQDLAETPFTRMIALLQHGQQAFAETNFDDAATLFENGLTLAETQQHRQAQALFHESLGYAYTEIDRLQQALLHHRQALEIDRSTADPQREAADLGNIGTILTMLDRPGDALDAYEQALPIHRRLADPAAEAGDLLGIGIAYKNFGRAHQGLAPLQRALEIYRNSGDLAGEGAVLNSIGNLYRNLGRYREALSRLERALSIQRELGDRHGEGKVLSNLGKVHDDLGRYEDALEHFEQAVAISYLLLGDGSQLTLEAFHRKRAYRLDAVDLLTLSACNTAIGAVGPSASGAEIESFGALAQKRGAKGVLATLWPVADQSTGILMQALYKLRGNDARQTKAEALRQAQLALLRGDDKEGACDRSRGKRRLLTPDPAQVPMKGTCRYSHPYYWAPFILMGNWL